MEDGTGRSRARKEDLAMVQVRNDGGSGQSVDVGGGDKGLDSASALKRNVPGFDVRKRKMSGIT